MQKKTKTQTQTRPDNQVKNVRIQKQWAQAVETEFKPFSLADWSREQLNKNKIK